MNNQVDPNILLDIVKTPMPFGKYEGTLIFKLPISYLEWFNRNGGFPKGKLGMLLETMYTIKLNGLDDLLKPIIQMKRLD
ncbi:MAG: DUF3820 family protein [Bacteroidetes bacterium]|jgi:uncharacterized protein (DUF3820 family)|nr:DUF3820 family protein [Bacteroidota bacterium]